MHASSDDSALIRDVIQRIEAGQDFDAEKRKFVFELLEAYECWTPLFKLLERYIKSSNGQDKDNYIRLARIQYLYLEDIFAASETCALAVSNLNLCYRDFLEFIRPALFEHEDYPCEATLVHALIDRFKRKEDKVAALERLCLLYEKKTFNENHLNESYTALLDLDPLNVKALRYFKLLFTQNYEWEKVIAILRSLIQASKHPRDVFRVAQELAAVLLYQLDQPREAISIIDSFCEGSPLDTSTISYDAFQRLGDWRGCLKVLRECLLSLNDDRQRAVIHYRVGQLEEKTGQPAAAVAEYEQVIALDPKFYEAYEQLIGLSLQARQWENAIKITDKLANALDGDEGARVQIVEARDRLVSGFSHAKQG